MKTRNDPDMAALDALLQVARDAPLEVPDGLTARVLSDAQKLQPQAPGVARARPAASVIVRLRAALGGWQGVGGLVAATCAGFWIGVSPPAALPDAGAFILGVQAVSAAEEDAGLTGFGWDMEEG